MENFSIATENDNKLSKSTLKIDVLEEKIAPMMFYYIHYLPSGDAEFVGRAQAYAKEASSSVWGG